MKLLSIEYIPGVEFEADISGNCKGNSCLEQHRELEKCWKRFHGRDEDSGRNRR